MRLRRVVVTGSECTGKTTLAGRLAERFDAPCSQEYARLHQERKPTPLDVSDVEPIARGQQALEDEAIRGAGAGLVVHDTDLLSTFVYARHYYGWSPEWLAPTLRERLADLYLLCHPDVAWIADGLQRDVPHEREAIHKQFRDTLAAVGARVVGIRGPWVDREGAALSAVEELVEPS